MNSHLVQPPPTLHLKAIDATDMWRFFSDSDKSFLVQKHFFQ
jgi:hypothetical protein